MDLPSAGSVFKRPEGFFTGKLIEECGLKGWIGDAAILEKHCGFIVNLGSATAKDVFQLIKHIQKLFMNAMVFICKRKFVFGEIWCRQQFCLCFFLWFWFCSGNLSALKELSLFG